MRSPDGIVAEWYCGEVGGAALFGLLASRAAPTDALKWQALKAVESRMNQRLAETLNIRGVPLPDTSHLAQRAHQRCEPLRNLSWNDSMHWLHEIADAALVRMRSDAATLPAELAAVGDLVVAHEIALLEFALRELAPSEAARSLQPIEDFMAHTAPKPQGPL